MSSIVSPFKFLDSFTREDREIFFGREKEIEELYRKVFESKILLLYGVSGTGKSSLIHCGLANKIQESDWLPVNVRRGGDFLESMALALLQVALSPLPDQLNTPLQFKKAVRSVYLDHYKPVFFLFDQFEELFIFGSARERELFQQVLKSLLASDIQCRFVFILREEYLASLSHFEKAIPGFFSNRLRIERMSLENAKMVIEGPCRVHGIELEEGFTQKVLDKLCPDENEVELTFLQVYLDRLYRLAAKQQGDATSLRFHAPRIEEAGSVTDILGNFVDEQIAQQENPELALAALKAFVSSRGTRQPMDATEVRDYAQSLGKIADEKELISLLARFVNLRILHDKDQHGKYELRHDALAAKIFEKFTLVEKELLEVRRFVENAFQNYRARGILLNSEDLAYLGGYSSRLILPLEMDGFVNTSRQKLYARQNAFRRLSWVSAVLFILMVAGVIRYINRTQSNEGVKELINLALLQSEPAPLQSLATAIQAWELDSSSVLLHQLIIRNAYKLIYQSSDSNVLLQALQTAFAPVDLGSDLLHAEMSRDGKIIFGWQQDQSVFIYKTAGRMFSRFKVKDEILSIKCSPRDEKLAVILRNGKCLVMDWDGNTKYAIQVTPNYLLNERLVVFFPEGKYDLAGVSGSDAIIVDSTGRILFRLKGHTGSVNSLDISPDGRFVATASSDKQVLIWNFNHKSKSFSPYDTLIGHRDTVWSCEFSRRGLYVLTASADTTIGVWDLYGNLMNTQFYFGQLIGLGDHSKTTEISNDPDKYDPQFSLYYRRACNASFTMREMAIVVSDYGIDQKGRPSHRQFLLFDQGALWLQRIKDNIIWGLLGESSVFPPVSFVKVVTSPDCRIAAVVLPGEEHIQLSSLVGFNILEIAGSFPMFSKDGMYFYWVKGTRINILPLIPAAMRHDIHPEHLKEKTGIKTIWTPL
ncbi:MAG: AAA family ATPase [Bacteroidales bacterium]